MLSLLLQQCDSHTPLALGGGPAPSTLDVCLTLLEWGRRRLCPQACVSRAKVAEAALLTLNFQGNSSLYLKHKACLQTDSSIGPSCRIPEVRQPSFICGITEVQNQLWDSLIPDFWL